MSVRPHRRRRHLIPAATLASVVVLAAAASPPATAGGGWTWPVSGEVITPYRNSSDPYAGGQHRGIDVAAAVGTPVVAATAGTVRFAGVAGSSGLTVSVRTADGRFDTSYLHLSAAHVTEGERLALGERVGAVGTSGRPSTALPHLHFGVREAGSRHAYRDPLALLPPPGSAPVRERPRHPMPVPGPVRPAPAPEPISSPTRSRRPVRAPRSVRVRVPAGRRIRVPAGRPLPAPRPAPGPSARPTPAVARRRVPVRPRVRGRAPSSGPAGTPQAVPAGEPDPRPPPARQPRPVPGVDAGPDIGWALACLGLLLAAACLGRGDERGESPRPAWIGALLRPLLGRR